VVEYWSVEKKDINPLVIAPIPQYSNTPKSIKIESTTMDYLLVGYRPFFFVHCNRLL